MAFEWARCPNSTVSPQSTSAYLPGATKYAPPHPTMFISSPPKAKYLLRNNNFRVINQHNLGFMVAVSYFWISCFIYPMSRWFWVINVQYFWNDIFRKKGRDSQEIEMKYQQKIFQFLPPQKTINTIWKNLKCLVWSLNQ